jgi:hypothetical protein
MSLDISVQCNLTLLCPLPRLDRDLLLEIRHCRQDGRVDLITHRPVRIARSPVAGLARLDDFVWRIVPRLCSAEPFVSVSY